MGTATEQQRKVIDSITQYAEANRLQPGDKLPPIRDIAREFGIGHVTVARAISHMARDGLLVTQKKGGTRLAKSLSSATRQPACRIIVLNHVIGDTWDVTQETLFNTLTGIKHFIPNAELISLWHSTEDGVEGLKNVLYYHYSLRSQQNHIVFLLTKCPRWVKSHFQENRIPAVVLGGNEEGIRLPNVSTDPDYVMDEMIGNIESQNAFPVVLLMSSEIVGTFVTYSHRFRELGDKRGSSTKGNMLLLNSSPEIMRGQIIQLLSSKVRPRTLVVPSDEMGAKVVRICHDIGMRIPQDVGIISIQNSSLGEQLNPRLTGFFVDSSLIGGHLAEIIKHLMAGEDQYGKTYAVKPVMVYRESFVFQKQ